MRHYAPSESSAKDNYKRKRAGGQAKKAVIAAAALGVAVTMVIPSAANAATPVVSQANGRLIQTSLLTQNLLDQLVALKGAQAVNTDATADVTSDTPLDASVVSGLVTVKAGTSNLFGSNGIIQLGAVGQYSQANSDGSSTAFSGAVSQAPSLIGVNTVQAGPNIGAPSANSTAQITVGTDAILGGDTNLVNLDIALNALAASASETTGGVQSGDYSLADVGIDVNGAVMQPVAALYPLVTAVLDVANVVLSPDLDNPLNSDGSVHLSLQNLLDAAGVATINDLPAGTDLLSYVPQAVVNTVTGAVQNIVDQVSDVPLIGTVLSSLTTAVSGLAGDLLTPLGDAVTAIAQLQLNVKTTNTDSSFTQTAARLGLGASGALATVSLATATVGPNAGPEAVPILNADSAGIAGGVLALTAGVLMALWWRRRQTAYPRATVNS